LSLFLLIIHDVQETSWTRTSQEQVTLEADFSRLKLQAANL